MRSTEQLVVTGDVLPRLQWRHLMCVLVCAVEQEEAPGGGGGQGEVAESERHRKFQ